MIEYIEKINNIDIAHKYQWIKGNNKIKLEKISINTNNNDFIGKKKDIGRILYWHMRFLNRKSKIKVSKRSIAAFQLREGDIIGTETILWNKKNHYLGVNELYKELVYYLLSHLDKVNIIEKGKYNYTISYGISNYDKTYYKEEERLGGSNIQIMIKSPVRYLGDYYLKIKN